MCQCLEVGFGTVSEVISSQGHPLNCTKQGSSFNTAIMLKKNQFLNTVIEDDSNIVVATKETGIDCPEPAARETDCGNTGHATKEAVDDNIALGECTAATNETDSDSFTLGECTSATEERDSDNEALGESTAATKASAVKEANIRCGEYVTNETDVDCSSPFTDRKRNCNSTISSDIESDRYHEAPSKDSSDDSEKETKDGHRVPNSKETKFTTKKKKGDHTSSTISRKKKILMTW